MSISNTVSACHSCLRIACACLSWPLEVVVLSLSLTGWCFSLDLLPFEVSTGFWTNSLSSQLVFLYESVRCLIWIFAGLYRFLNRVGEFGLIDNHRIMKTNISWLHTFFMHWAYHDALRLVTKVFLVTTRTTSDAAHITHACCTVDNTCLWNSIVLSIHHHLSFLHILWILTIVRKLLKIWNVNSAEFSLGVLRHVSAWTASVVCGAVNGIIIIYLPIALLEILSLCHIILLCRIFGWYVTVCSSSTQKTRCFI